MAVFRRLIPTWIAILDPQQLCHITQAFILAAKLFRKIMMLLRFILKLILATPETPHVTNPISDTR
jgi:hypothetical protein